MSIVLSAITEPYAKALLDFAVAKDALETTTRDIKLILQLVKKSDPLMNFLCNPFIAKIKKREVLKDIFKDLELFLTRQEVHKLTRKIYIDDFIPNSNQTEGDAFASLENSIRNETLNFVLLLLDRDRIEIMESIFESFLKLSDERNPVRNVDITTAMQLSTQQQELLKEKVKNLFGFKEVKLSIRIDSNLIGGLIIKSGTTLIDGTLKKRLEKMSCLFDA